MPRQNPYIGKIKILSNLPEERIKHIITYHAVAGVLELSRRGLLPMDLSNYELSEAYLNK